MSRTGSRIKQLRERRGWTQLELAERAGINNSVLSRIEANKRPVSAEELKKFAVVFNVSTDHLSGHAEPTKSPAAMLVEYLEMELTNEEIINQMNFTVDGMTLTDEEAAEFVDFVRAKRIMRMMQQQGASKGEDR